MMISRRCLLNVERLFSTVLTRPIPKRFKILKLINVESTRFYPTVHIPGIPQIPKELTRQGAEERTLKAIKAWDRFPQDRLDKLNLESRFQEDLSFDSLDQVEIIMSLEDEFGIEITDTDTEKFKTPSDIVKFICEHENVLDL